MAGGIEIILCSTTDRVASINATASPGLRKSNCQLSESMKLAEALIEATLSVVLNCSS